MKSISSETFARLQSIVAGNAGSQGEISLRHHDLMELRAVASGDVLSELESLPSDDRSVMISVPLLAKAVKQAAQSVDGDADLGGDEQSAAPKKKPARTR